MSMTTYTLSGYNKFEVFDNGSSYIVLFVDEHCHRIYSRDIENCGYAILKFFNYNGLVNLLNDFNTLKEDFLIKVKSPNFNSVLSSKGILIMGIGIYCGGYLALDIEEGEIKGHLHISFNNWSPDEIENAFREADDYITRFKIQRLLLCEKLIAEIKEVCKQEGIPFKDPFDPPKKKEQKTQGFFNWLINLFR